MSPANAMRLPKKNPVTNAAKSVISLVNVPPLAEGEVALAADTLEAVEVKNATSEDELTACDTRG